MPTYVYQEIDDDGSEGEIFEIEQAMTDPPLTQHPTSGKTVRRVYLPPNIGSKYTEGRTKSLLETRNVERAGFTKYERDKLTGTYHKVAGESGPSKLNPHS